MEKLILQATTSSVSLLWPTGNVYKQHKIKELWRRNINYLKYNYVQVINMKVSGVSLGAGLGTLSLDKMIWSNGYLVDFSVTSSSLVIVSSIGTLLESALFW